MRQRCLNPKNDCYTRYGGRGITICSRWNQYENFIADMGPRPGPEYQIERRDNNGPYSPDNCYWATRHEQCRNRKSSVTLTYKGVTKCVTDWAVERGVPPYVIFQRLYRGWPVERAIETPQERIYA